MMTTSSLTWTYLSSINSNDEVEWGIASVHHFVVLVLHKRALSGQREEIESIRIISLSLLLKVRDFCIICQSACTDNKTWLLSIQQHINNTNIKHRWEHGQWMCLVPTQKFQFINGNFCGEDFSSLYKLFVGSHRLLTPGQTFSNDVGLRSDPLFYWYVFVVLAEPRLALFIHQQHKLQHLSG